MSDSRPAHSRGPVTRRMRQMHVLEAGLAGVAFAGVGAVTLTKSEHIGVIAVGLGMLVLGVALTVLPVLGNRRIRKQHLRRVAALAEARRRAPAASSIVEAAGRCRIMGRVHLIASARGADGDVAASLICTVAHQREWSEVPKGGYTDVTDLTEVRTCGRFAVIDDTAVAIVDPEDFEVISRVAHEPFEPVTTSARHDDMVEIIGTGRRVAAGEVDGADEVVRAGGYREGERTVLLFDGKEAPVLIVARRRE